MLSVVTTEMHTAGDPVRIVKSSDLPPIFGKTILEKTRYFRQHLDYIRKFLIYEPNGHHDMFGVIVVGEDKKHDEFGLIFLHKGGYAPACGHVIISLGRYILDQNLLPWSDSTETKVTFQCPCGPIDAYVEHSNGKSGKVRFQSGPSYIFAKDVTVAVPGLGKITTDICFGGGFYAILPAQAVGLNVRTSPTEILAAAGDAITGVLKSTVKITHPERDDIAYLYGTVLTDDGDGTADANMAQICVYGDKQVARSPSGSSTVARIAQLYQKGYMKLNQIGQFRGPSGAIFTGMPVEEVKFGRHQAVIVEVAGKGYYCGNCKFILEADDSLGHGFLLK